MAKKKLPKKAVKKAVKKQAAKTFATKKGAKRVATKKRTVKRSASAGSKVQKSQSRLVAIKRTPPLPFDVAVLAPDLLPFLKTTVRLHPVRLDESRSLPRGASKIGGEFLWPHDEPWPRCDDSRHQTGVRGRESVTDGISPLLVPVLQLRAEDVPELVFPDGKDLFQLLWCPTTEDTHDNDYLFPKPFAFWRRSAEIPDLLPATPEADVTEGFNQLVPCPCSVGPERVVEFPSHVPGVDYSRLKSLPEDVGWYQWVLACPSTKVGGHPNWVQDAEEVTCSAGHKMEFLLQLGDWEYANLGDPATLRWVPLEDRWAVQVCLTNHHDEAASAVLRPTGFDFSGCAYYVFICRTCADWPVKLIYQR